MSRKVEAASEFCQKQSVVTDDGYRGPRAKGTPLLRTKGLYEHFAEVPIALSCMLHISPLFHRSKGYFLKFPHQQQWSTNAMGAPHVPAVPAEIVADVRDLINGVIQRRRTTKTRRKNFSGFGSSWIVAHCPVSVMNTGITIVNIKCTREKIVSVTSLCSSTLFCHPETATHRFVQYGVSEAPFSLPKDNSPEKHLKKGTCQLYFNAS